MRFIKIPFLLDKSKWQIQSFSKFLGSFQSSGIGSNNHHIFLKLFNKILENGKSINMENRNFEKPQNSFIMKLNGDKFVKSHTFYKLGNNLGGKTFAGS